MSIERRLHGAAHELREIDIAVPAFEPAAAPSAVMRRIGPIAVAGLLAVIGIGGVVAVGNATTPQTVDSLAAAAAIETPTEAPAIEAPADVGSVGRSTLTPRQEIAIIASLGVAPDGDGHEDADSVEVDIPSGVS